MFKKIITFIQPNGSVQNEFKKHKYHCSNISAMQKSLRSSATAVQDTDSALVITLEDSIFNRKTKKKVKTYRIYNFVK
tara:strand:+ start:418 stop:651 length:234 start_codon:yes stop_codon:yes gene_type:complete